MSSMAKLPYLCEDLVLVHGDHSAECEGRDLLDHDGVGRPVAFELLVRSDTGNFVGRFACVQNKMTLHGQI